MAARAGCPLSHPDPEHPGGTDPRSAAGRKVILHGHVLPEALPSPLCQRDGAISVIYPTAVHSQSSAQLFKKGKKKEKKSGFRPFLQIQPHFSSAPGESQLNPIMGQLWLG